MDLLYPNSSDPEVSGSRRRTPEGPSKLDTAAAQTGCELFLADSLTKCYSCV